MYLAQLMAYWRKKFYSSSSHCLSQLWQFQTAFSGNTCLTKTGNKGMLNPRLFHSTLGTLQMWVPSHGYTVAFNFYFPYLNKVLIRKFRPMKLHAADCSTKSVFQPCHIYRHAELHYEMCYLCCLAESMNHTSWEKVSTLWSERFARHVNWETPSQLTIQHCCWFSSATLHYMSYCRHTPPYFGPTRDLL